MKEKDLDKATDENYFDASVIESGQHPPSRTHQMEFHSRCSMAQLRLSLIACICKKLEAKESQNEELYAALSEVQGLISNVMLHRTNNGPYYLKKRAESCKHRSAW